MSNKKNKGKGQNKQSRRSGKETIVNNVEN
jgi:hypothetical protein